MIYRNIRTRSPYSPGGIFAWRVLCAVPPPYMSWREYDSLRNRVRFLWVFHAVSIVYNRLLLCRRWRGHIRSLFIIRDAWLWNCTRHSNVTQRTTFFGRLCFGIGKLKTTLVKTVVFIIVKVDEKDFL